MELYEQSAAALSALLREKRLSAVELARSLLWRIDDTDPAVGAFIAVCREEALKEAQAMDDRRARGEALPPLAGIPVAVKDNICVKGTPTTCASKMLWDFVPPYDATVVEKLRAAGLVVMGKVNLDEFAMGGAGETSYGKTARNPHDVSRVTGGSSSGSAAALAAGQVPLALGTDTGGSVRIPASFCGVTGLRPTYGAVSRQGVVATASSMDQVGPMARDMRDTALLYDVICGWDERDSTSVRRAYAPVAPALTGDVRGLRIGIPRACLDGGVQDEVVKALSAAAAHCEALGAHVFETSLPMTELSVPIYYAIFTAEAASHLARFDGVRFGHRAEAYGNFADLCRKSRSEGFGMEVKRRLMVGAFVTSAGRYDAYYQTARAAAQRLRAEYDRTLSECDVLLTPATPTTAFLAGGMANPSKPLSRTNWFTTGASLAGLPALSLPFGRDGQGLPIGLQLIGRRFEESVLLNAGYALEAARGPIGVAGSIQGCA